MSNNQEQNNSSNPSEEIDLVVIFNFIGRAFNNFLNFIKGVFKSIFSLVVYSIKAIINNFKIILIVLFLAALSGYFMDSFKPPVYSAQMLVKPYFDSKYQLVNSINYYNALLSNEDYSTISKIFSIPESEAKDLIEFEIKPGPETENDRIVQYDQFIKSIDSVRAQEVGFEDFIDNRSIYSGDLFEIEVLSYKNDIFSKLEGGLGDESFTNAYSDKKMKKRDSLIIIQKNNIITQLAQVDSLQKIYIRVLEEESKSKPTEFSIGGEGFSLSKDKTTTREFELLNKEIDLRNQLRQLDEKKVEENEFFDVISSFQEVGSKKSEWYDQYKLVFPMLSFVLLVFGFLVKKTVIYVKNYES